MSEFKAVRKAKLAITGKLTQSEKRQGRAKCSHRGSFKTWNIIIKLSARKYSLYFSNL